MPSAEYLRQQIARLRKEEGDLLKKQADARTAAAKYRSNAASKIQQASRTSSASSSDRYRREAARAEQEAAKQDTKVSDFAKKIATVSGKLATTFKSIERTEVDAARARKRDDDKRRRDEFAHARRVAQLGLPTVRYVHDTLRLPAPKPEILRVAYLTASPTGEEHLRIDREVREVREAVKRSLHRDLIDIKPWPAATFDDVVTALNDERPHVLHFSGHGSKDGLFFDGTDADQPDGTDVGYELLSRALAATSAPPRLIVLNSCDSFAGAEKLLEAVPVVIAMVDEIGDLAAKLFATRFYAAIASGQPLNAALEQACVVIEHSTGEGSTPEILHREDIDPTTTCLVVAPDED